MPYVQFAEVSTHRPTGELYCLVHFWPTKASFDAREPHVLTNDFIMQIRPTTQQVVTNDDGWMKRFGDGRFIDPATLRVNVPLPVWVMEDVAVDVRAEVLKSVENYWRIAQARKWTGDHTNDNSKPFLVDGVLRRQHKAEPLKRDTSDPHSLLTRSDLVDVKKNPREIA